MTKPIVVPRFGSNYVELARLLSSPSVVMRNDMGALIEVCTGSKPLDRLINRLKQYRRIATRYEKYAINYLAMLMIGAIRLWL